MLKSYINALSEKKCLHQHIKNQGSCISKKGISNKLNLKREKHLVESKIERLMTKVYRKII